MYRIAKSVTTASPEISAQSLGVKHISHLHLVRYCGAHNTDLFELDLLMFEHYNPDFIILDIGSNDIASGEDSLISDDQSKLLSKGKDIANDVKSPQDKGKK